ncbi:MAG: 3-deoxy-manno-octulosonate cytidylyltransferase [Armatimonadetes bacterium]|jgi:3-deoxy-manno-octulosonate cytidylyltransferase (CMP-KDO synthetase)|nr:3-deoxy-manno-octulosonate cytidylyltransferase [Armatimonadota bacterium]
MKSVVIIPARMAATRFPGKPLVDLCGKPMIRWVCERASRAAGISKVIVATCDREIVDAVKTFGGEAVMTSDTHRSGTDRLAEVAANLDADVIVNVQGDEPLIDPSSIELALKPFESSADITMTSLMTPIDSISAQDPNLVKVVVDVHNFALYFSRSPLPYERNALLDKPIYGHVGLYAYTRDFLLKFSSLQPTPLEKTESLEQLRVLEHGYGIKMLEVKDRPLGVDTLADLEKVRLAITDGDL